LFSRLLLVVATAVYLAIGGHRQVIEALLDTFAWLPAGQGGDARSAVEAVTVLFAQSFVLGVRAAAPAIVALLVATLIVAVASRTLPQLNVMALGLGVNAVVALVAIGVSLGGACWVFQDQLAGVLDTALYALRPH
jgi:flagellar biosynthetic protein FliR